MNTIATTHEKKGCIDDNVCYHLSLMGYHSPWVILLNINVKNDTMKTKCHENRNPFYLLSFFIKALSKAMWCIPHKESMIKSLGNRQFRMIMFPLMFTPTANNVLPCWRY